MSTPGLMRAAWYERNGPASEVLQVGHMEVPSVGPGDVRVRVHSSGINPSDVKNRAGATRRIAFPRVIPHSDGAGVVEAVGEAVQRGRIGERVWTFCAQWQRPFGTCAEYAVLPAEHAVPLPDKASFDEGACLGIPAVTAHRALFADGPVAGQTILITGGAGAVGSAAVQLAKWGEATVIATVSSDEKAAVARESGADYVVNYRAENVADRVLEITSGKRVDRVVDVGFGANLATSLAVLKPNGVIATYASDGGEREPRLPFHQLLTSGTTVRFVYMYLLPDAARDAAMADINAALAAGALRPRIGRVFALDQIVAAHEAVESGAVIGNVVVRI